MQTQTIDLLPSAPGLQLSIQCHHYGRAGAAPKAYIQAALHADEVPALLVAQHLRRLLQALDQAGQIVGEVLLVPYANPLGLSQHLWGQHVGRFNVQDGVNFNRQLPDVAVVVLQAVQGRLGPDAVANVALVKGALRAAAAALTATDTAQDLKNKLLQRAIDADVVLDLHCDNQAVMHLYGLTPQLDLCTELGALLGAQAVLLAEDSGGSPFDESCSRPWLRVQQAHPSLPLPLACFSTTVELRGQAETSHALAQQDALALIEFLRRRGIVSGTPAVLPAARCLPTPLAASEPIASPCAGVLVFHQEPGAHVQAGDLIADVTEPHSGERHALHTLSAGVLYARVATRWAMPGQQVAKVAGTRLSRSGLLLSP
jgi:uncharacterized protein